MAVNVPLRYARSVFQVSAFALAVMWLVACPINASAQVMYTIVDLGIPAGGTFTSGQSVNNSGQVAAYANNGAGQQAFRVNQSQVIGSPGTNLGGIGQAFGINASGQVTGVFGLGDEHRAFRTTSNGLITDTGADLGVLPGHNRSWGYAINNSGQVTGYSFADSLGFARVFRTSSTGTLADAGANIGVLPGSFSGEGRAINSLGQVAGYCYFDASDTNRAFRTTPNGRVDDPGTDLGTLGGNKSEAYGINDVGQTVGTSRIGAGNITHAFRTSPNGLISDPGTDLGTLPGSQVSTAYAINNSGVVVGTSGSAFVYDTAMRDLNSLIPSGTGWQLDRAFSISDLGWITGSGRIGGQLHAFLLIPVPEPTSLMLVAGTFVGGWAIRKWRRA